jgi:hypothetical protein
MNIGEVAATTSRDLYLPADLFIVFEKHHPLSAIRGSERAEHAGTTASDHNDVVDLVGSCISVHQ